MHQETHTHQFGDVGLQRLLLISKLADLLEHALDLARELTSEVFDVVIDARFDLPAETNERSVTPSSVSERC